MLSVLGITGFTAYFGLLEIGKPKPGETVLVSAAAGATGSIVGQIAKIKGCKVVGIAGTDEKCKWITQQLGFDSAINYKTTKNLSEDIRKACPEGIDIYFDNVGGYILDTALKHIRKNARIVICGAISQYNNRKITGPANYMSLLINRARMEGFLVSDYRDRFPEAMKQLSLWVQQNKIYYKEHKVKGLEKAPETLIWLFEGKNEGKLMIQVREEPTRLSKL